ncbi:polysaccharide biosynthesis C-terminal domain-containing protein [Occallatibacter riparius]|uniref:Capsular polysaccharide assembling protein CapF C-terminal domain-containing protein n=1 Tax=Occallatibacter riparius TaxID=1002689 RepID=A0A9J7BXY6_9BACT|nr:hypothetical protein [Occallatibacter riparius]UWZ86157.1 hypothetical protein MOP44_09465 [Occallatibacter riparius]
MSESSVKFTELVDSGDERGLSFQTGTSWIKFLGSVEDGHVATILPGRIRGNHYHAEKREVIVVLSKGSWTLTFNQGPGTDAETRAFARGGAVILEIQPGASHAILNCGNEPLWTFSFANLAWNPERMDSFPCVLAIQSEG